ncbi:MAG TPA: serine/threonine-protein kinase [Vicinamibacteria bacterium]
MADAAKYKILHELGTGGMGKVYKGLLVGQSGFQRPIVIKQLKTQDPHHVKLFVDEARRYAVLDHENIGRIFDFDDVDGELCIILEHIDGWSLIEYLRRHRELMRFPDVDLSVFIASRVCRALQYVYERAHIVHRDISPSNIMMTREGTVKLIDFGIATRSGTRDSSITGKPSYMAPEMVVELRADNRSDIFSLGTVLYEMLAGERLFPGRTTGEILEKVIGARIPSARTVNPTVPQSAAVIVHKALQRDPSMRYESAGEMGEACEHYLYDKGYGPTNLTLKHYVTTVFPEPELLLEVEATERFPQVATTVLPAGATAAPKGPDPSDGETMVAPLSSAYARVVAARAATAITEAGPTIPTEDAPPRKRKAPPRK